MDGLCRAVGAPTPVMWQGEMRIVSPLRLVDIGTIEHYILNQRRRRSPVTIARRKMDEFEPRVAAEMLKIAEEEDRRIPNYVSPGEMQVFLESRDGASLTWWLMLRQHLPAESFEDVSQHMRGLNVDDFEDLLGTISLVSGFSEACERDWKIDGLDDDDDDGDDDAAKRKRFNWKHAVRRVCEAYLGMTPDACGQLTVYTFRQLYIDAADLKGKRMSIAEWRERQRHKEQREQEQATARDGINGR